MNTEARVLRAVIVDDEAPARSLLREYLSAHADVEVLAECANGFEAVKTIGEVEPNLVFLDIQMPKLDGFEVLELLAPGPAVVFVTAYDEFALKAFDVNAVDYLLKPYGAARLAEALARVREHRPLPTVSPSRLAAPRRTFAPVNEATNVSAGFDTSSCGVAIWRSSPSTITPTCSASAAASS